MRFAYRHSGCWLQETSERHPDVTLFVSAMYVSKATVHIQLVVRCGNANEMGQVIDEWRGDPRVRSVTAISMAPWGGRFQAEYLTEGSTVPVILHHRPVSVGTVRVARGSEFYAIVGAADETAALLSELSRIGELRILRSHKLESTPDELGLGPELEWAQALTPRQRDAMLRAHREGYYEWPRRHSVSAIAQQHGLAASTFLDSLRRGESKVLHRLLDELSSALTEGGRTLAGSATAPTAMPRAAKTRAAGRSRGADGEQPPSPAKPPTTRRPHRP